jgi:hypothetical protein
MGTPVTAAAVRTTGVVGTAEAVTIAHARWAIASGVSGSGRTLAGRTIENAVIAGKAAGAVIG